MAILFDPEKNALNITVRGLSFALVEQFEWDTAAFIADDRRDYGENRWRIFGMLNGKLHVAVVTPRDEDLRVISLRRANKREERLYANF